MPLWDKSGAAPDERDSISEVMIAKKTEHSQNECHQVI
jgi:hypothetical protein